MTTESKSTPAPMLDKAMDELLARGVPHFFANLRNARFAAKAAEAKRKGADVHPAVSIKQ